MLTTEVIVHFMAVHFCSFSTFLLFLGFLRLETIGEKRERKWPDTEENGLVF